MVEEPKDKSKHGINPTKSQTSSNQSKVQKRSKFQSSIDKNKIGKSPNFQNYSYTTLEHQKGSGLDLMVRTFKEMQISNTNDKMGDGEESIWGKTSNQEK